MNSTRCRANPARPHNLIGYPGSYFSDLCYHILGFGSFVAPALLFLLGVKWVRSQPLEAPWIRMIGSATLLLGTCTALSLAPEWRPFGGVILAGGLTSQNVAQAIRLAQPDTVDTASGVESAPGKKDPAKIQAFIAEAKKALT